MKTKLSILAVAVAAATMAGGTLFAQPRVSVGIGVGGYAPGYAPPAYDQYVPPCPGPGYVWVDGYWAPQGQWIAGYWRAPVVTYVAPRSYGGAYYNGFRGGEHFENHGRDYDRGRERYDNHERDENRGGNVRSNGNQFRGNDGGHRR